MLIPILSEANAFRYYIHKLMCKKRYPRKCVSDTHLYPIVHLLSLISLCCVHEKTLHLRLSSKDSANTQAVLNLQCVHMSDDTFSEVVAHIMTRFQIISCYNIVFRFDQKPNAAEPGYVDDAYMDQCTYNIHTYRQADRQTRPKQLIS